MRTCTICGSELPEGCVTCPVCGSPCVPQNTCPTCGTPVANGTKTCPVCGHEFASAATEYHQESSPEENNYSDGDSFESDYSDGDGETSSTSFSSISTDSSVKSKDSLAVVGLVLSILGYLCIFGLPISIVCLVRAIKGKKSKAIPIAGIAVSGSYILIAFIVVMVLVVAPAARVSAAKGTYYRVEHGIVNYDDYATYDGYELEDKDGHSITYISEYNLDEYISNGVCKYYGKIWIHENHKHSNITVGSAEGHYKACKYCGVYEDEISSHNIVDDKCKECGYDGTSQGLSFREDGNKYVVEGIGICRDTVVIIPSKYNDKKVTGISGYPGAFANDRYITGIVIPDTIKSISGDAFSNCTALKAVYYDGSSTDWDKLSIYSSTFPAGTKIYFRNNCTHNGNYWRYDEYVPTTEPACRNWTVGVAATCTTDGLKYGTCRYCSEEVTQVIPKLGHRIGSDGYCSVCGTALYTVSNNSFSLSGGVLKSTNHSDNSSATYTVRAVGNVYVMFEYKVSCENSWDKFTISKNGSALAETSGTSNSYQSLTVILSAGDTLTFTYSKDGSGNGGDDCAYIKNLNIESIAAGQDYLVVNNSDTPFTETDGELVCNLKAGKSSEYTIIALTNVTVSFNYCVYNSYGSYDYLYFYKNSEQLTYKSSSSGVYTYSYSITLYEGDVFTLKYNRSSSGSSATAYCALSDLVIVAA